MSTQPVHITITTDHEPRFQLTQAGGYVCCTRHLAQLLEQLNQMVDVEAAA